jgi:hypothetical protein
LINPTKIKLQFRSMLLGKRRHNLPVGFLQGLTGQSKRAGMGGAPIDFRRIGSEAEDSIHNSRFFHLPSLLVSISAGGFGG